MPSLSRVLLKGAGLFLTFASGYVLAVVAAEGYAAAQHDDPEVWGR